MAQPIKTKLSKGFQTVLPATIREKFQAKPGDEIIWSIIGDEVFIRIKKNEKNGIIKDLIGAFSTKDLDNATNNIDKTLYEGKWVYFIDSGVFIGAFNKKDFYHDKASKIINSIINDEIQKCYFSDYIFDEVTTYIRKKIGAAQSIKVAEALLNFSKLKFLIVDEATVYASFHLFKRYERLSFTDSISIVLMKNYKINKIFSFDSGFNGIKDIIRLTEPI